MLFRSLLDAGYYCSRGQLMFIGERLADMWAAKLARDYPARVFEFFVMDEGDGAPGALVKMQSGGPTSGNGVIVYFSCKDCAAEAGRVVSNGGKVIKEKFALGQHSFSALITDTEGNVLGLHSIH